jgi:hypothetical protein
VRDPHSVVHRPMLMPLAVFIAFSSYLTRQVYSRRPQSNIS